jgi:hypothetical protein
MTIARPAPTGATGNSRSTEAQLLLMTAAPSPSGAAIRQVIGDGIDWERLCSLASSEKAAPVLLRQLSAVGVAPTNPGYQRLRELATLSVMQMLQLEEMLRQSLEFLAEHKVEAMLLKGAGLAYTAYQSFPDRPMGDIDLLLRTEDAERAWSLLRTRGWTPAPIMGTPERYAGHHHLPPLFHDSAKCRLEIHDEILSGENPFRFSTDAFWNRARRITVNGRVMTVPDPIHQLWHTCVHFAWSHAMEWGGWRALRDVEAISSAGRFDWTGFARFARETRAATCCYWPLRMARHIAGAAVPDDVLASLRPPYPELVIGRLERHFTSSLLPSEQTCPSVKLSRLLWEAGVSPGWSGHGRARPWQVTERWASSQDLPEFRVQRNSMAVVRHIAAGISYLAGLTRFAVATAAVDLGSST